MKLEKIKTKILYAIMNWSSNKIGLSFQEQFKQGYKQGYKEAVNDMKGILVNNVNY